MKAKSSSSAFECTLYEQVEAGATPFEVMYTPSARTQEKALRLASASIQAGDLRSFFETLSIASFSDAITSITLARPQDTDCPLIGASKGFEYLTGFSRNEVIGRNCRFLSNGCSVAAQDRHGMRIAVQTGKSFRAVLQNRRKSGEVFMNLLQLSTLRIGTAVYIIGVQADVTGNSSESAERTHDEELGKIVDGIFLANLDAWATLKGSQAFGRLSSPWVADAESWLQPPPDPEQFELARSAFVALEPDFMPNQFLYKNTFLEVYDTDEDPATVLMSLRRVASEPIFSLQIRALEAEQAAELAAAAGTNSMELFDEETAGEMPPPPAYGTEKKKKKKTFGDDDPLAEDCSGAAGSLCSAGSSGHPDMCTPCSFHCYSLQGCNRGQACLFCHMDHPKKGRRRGRKKRASPMEEDDISRDKCGTDSQEVMASSWLVEPQVLEVQS